MSFGVPAGENREENLRRSPLEFGSGFRTIDNPTVTGNTPIATSSTFISTIAETTTLATLTRSKSLTGNNPSSSIISKILEDLQSTSTRSLPTTRPPLVTPSLPTFPTLVMASDAQRTVSATGTEASVPTASNGSENNRTSSQSTEATSRPISPGGAAGIAIAVVVVLILLGFGIFRYMQQKKRQNLPSSSDPKKGKSAQMAVLPYMGNERSLEEGWESETTISPYLFDDPHGSGLGLSGIGEQRNSNASLTRLPIHR